MNKTIKIGVLKETKSPPDKRVAVTPTQAKKLIKRHPELEIYVQSSDIRCFDDSEYIEAGVKVVDDVSFCDVLIGVKEVSRDKLIEGKTYFFFSHTAKEQAYNRDLLRDILKKNITLIDYEYLVNDNNKRLIAFSRWAGIIGCYNGLAAFGKRNNSFELKSADKLDGIMGMFSELDKIDLPPIKIAVTGHGRAGKGAVEVLNYLMIEKVSPSNFVHEEYDHPVYTVLEPKRYVKRADAQPFTLEDFFSNPKEFKSNFFKYAKVADFFVACHFWHPDSPAMFTREEMQSDDFNISVVADITCDIRGSIPSTIRPSTISEPFYGYDPVTDSETDYSNPDAVTVMAVDNLPGELPRDASEEFSGRLADKILPLLVLDRNSGVLTRATITENGSLTDKFSYLENFVNGN